MKKNIIGFGAVSMLAVLASATSAMARDYDSYNDKVRACKQQQRNGGVVGGFIGAGAGAAAGRALAAAKVRPEGVILGTVVGAVIGSQVGKSTVECGDLEYQEGGYDRYNDNQGRYYGDKRGRSYGEGYVMNGSRPYNDRDGTPEDMYPLGHNDYYGNGNGRPVAPPQQSYGYNDGWYVPSQYSYYGQQQQSSYYYSNSQSYSAPVMVSETYSGPTYIPAPPYTPAPIYTQPVPQPMPMPMPAPGQVIQTPQGTYMVVCDGQ
jgi:hypothetical protein